MSNPLYALATIALGTLGAYILYSNFGEETSTIESIIKLLINVIWILAAVVSAFTGFYVVAFLMLALWGSFAMKNYRVVREGNLSGAGGRSLRQKASTWTPSWVSGKGGRR